MEKKTMKVSLYANSGSINPIIVKEGELDVEVSRISIHAGDDIFTITVGDNGKLIYQRQNGVNLYTIKNL